MEHHVGIDVSLDLSSVCVLDAAGKVVREAKVASEPEALVAFLRGLELPVARVGLEAGPLSQWLYDGLREAGFETVLLETRHVKAALSAMAVKTDRRDARGIAQLLRMGWFRPVHRKSVPSQEVRALLGARKQLQIKVMDLEQTLRGLLRGFGLKVGDVSRGKLPARVRELVAGHAMLERIVEPLPEVLEPVGGELGVAGGVLDVAVPEPFLDRPGVVPAMGEREAAAMAQHVRVDREGEPGRHPDHRQLLPEPGGTHRGPPLGGEQVRGGRCLLALQSAQGAQLGAADRVHTGAAVLQPLDMEMSLRQVEHVPAQADQFGDPQAVAIGDEDHGGVAMAVAAGP